MAGVVLEGRMFSGMGKGRLFLGIRGYLERIERGIGFRPFPGTLNLRLEETGVELPEGIMIEGFKEEGKEFGAVRLIPCKVRGVSCAVVIPEKTRYGPEVLEIISRENLRERLGLKDGDTVRVEL
jgi:riboflavin kinase